MTALIIDTAFDTCQVALAIGDNIIAEKRAPGGGQHDRILGGMVRDLLLEQNIDIASLERIFVGTGPGRFTGLRIGIAFARGLCLVHKTPLIGVNALDALEVDMGPFIKTGERAAGVVTVKRGESFVRFVGTDAIERIEDADLNGFLTKNGPLKIAGILSPAVQELVEDVAGITILPVTEPSLAALLAAGRTAASSALGQDVVRPYYAPSYVASDAS